MLRLVPWAYHSRPQRPRPFWSAPRIATSGQVQWHSDFEWICKHNRLRPEPIRFVRLDSEHAQSERKSVNRGLPLLDLARRPQVAILGADQKERGLSGRECEHINSASKKALVFYEFMSVHFKPCTVSNHCIYCNHNSFWMRRYQGKIFLSEACPIVRPFGVTVECDRVTWSYVKRQTAKMKLLPSIFSSLNSRVKIFVFVANSRRHFSIFMWFNEGWEEKNIDSEVIFAVWRKTTNVKLNLSNSNYAITNSNVMHGTSWKSCPALSFLLFFAVSF